MKLRFRFLLSSLTLVHFLALAAFAQDAKLVESAKKEGGKVVIYGSLENDTVDAVSKALKKKTGLEVEFWRGSATKVMDRVVSEYRAGKPLSDVVLTNDAPMRIMQQEGSFAAEGDIVAVSHKLSEPNVVERNSLAPMNEHIFEKGNRYRRLSGGDALTRRR